MARNVQGESRRLYDEGRLAMKAGRFDEATAAFRRSNALAPHFKTLELLGECLLQLGRAREAIEPLAAATALNPDPETGTLELDSSFRDPGAEKPGVSFERTNSRHGAAGSACPHGAVFSRIKR